MVIIITDIIVLHHQTLVPSRIVLMIKRNDI